MNNHIKGYHRDKAIFKVLEEQGVLDTDQLQLMFFPSLRMAQKRLQRLVELGKISRHRDYTGQPYYYYIDKRPRQVEHKLGVNWIRLWVERGLKSWESLYCWQYEPNYKSVRPDAFIAIKNTITGKLRFCFIERECDTNPFKKVKLYNDLYNSDTYGGNWWVEQAERFPSVVVVVESPKRFQTIQQLIAKENKHGLEFKPYLLEQIISEVKGVNV